MRARRSFSLDNAASDNLSTYKSDCFASATIGMGETTGTCIVTFTVGAAGQPNAGINHDSGRFGDAR